MKINKKTLQKSFRKAVEISVRLDANSTSSIIYYQPKAPVSLKKYSKIKNDK